MSTQPIFSLPLQNGGTLATKQGLDSEMNRIISAIWGAAVLAQLGSNQQQALIDQFVLMYEGTVAASQSAQAAVEAGIEQGTIDAINQASALLDDAVDQAEAARNAAIAAQNAATVNAQVYADTAAGIAATTNGQQFQVVTTNEVIRYRNNSGTAVEVARYPTSTLVNSIFTILTTAGTVSAVITGTADALIATPVSSLIPIGDNTIVMFQPIATNTGATTLKVGSDSVRNLVNEAGSALVAGDLRGAYVYTVRRRSGNWQIIASSYDGRRLRENDLSIQNKDMVFSFRRPIILDLEGVWGEVNTVYVSRQFFYFNNLNVWTVVNVANTLSDEDVNYCKFTLTSIETDDTSILNTIYYDPSDNLLKQRTGSGQIPLSASSTAHKLSLFEIGGINSWRSPMGVRIVTLSKPKGKDILRDLHDALRNPLRDAKITLIGDSITWGSNASDNGPSTPRNHALTDTRDIITSSSWANILRRWMAEMSSGGKNQTEPDPGVSTNEYDVVIDPFDDWINFPTINGTENRVIGRNQGTATTALFKHHVSTVTDGYLRFDVWGTEVTLVHAGFNVSNYEFYADGVLKATYDGSHLAAAVFGVETTLSGLGEGRHRIEVRAIGQFFRLEGIKRAKKFKFTNNGLIGTNTYLWRSTGPVLSGGVPSDTTHLIIQLGTNDRAFAGNTTTPTGHWATYNNLMDILNWLKTNRPNCRVILMAPPFVIDEETDSKSYEIAQSVRRVAEYHDVGFIDNWTPTWQLTSEGITWLFDSLHPNDTGHRAIANNIIRRIMNE